LWHKPKLNKLSPRLNLRPRHIPGLRGVVVERILRRRLALTPVNIQVVVQPDDAQTK
jgi:hypothetical protein